MAWESWNNALLRVRRLGKKVGDAGKGQADPKTEPREEETCGQSCDRELFAAGLRSWGLKKPQERLGEHWRGAEGRAGSGLWGVLPRNDMSPEWVFGGWFVKCSREERKKMLHRQRQSPFFEILVPVLLLRSSLCSSYSRARGWVLPQGQESSTTFLVRAWVTSLRLSVLPASSGVRERRVT